MEIDFGQLDPYARYKLMASLIVPRPIALVTTLGEDGTVNAAPFETPIANYYMTDAIGRASDTMAECTRTFLNGGAARTGTHG